ncbi:MAG: hypothetical protein J6X70_10350 [Muribaculaceae bacterium]|nr:hypothetical protein [Muribaculaceae bacterium]
MKKFLLLIAAMLVAVAAIHAQSPTATLSHDGTVKCFYGKEAFVNAVAASADGDRITLSSGLFTGTTIDKSITVKGAGMQPDTINSVEPTVISSDVIIGVPNVTVEALYMNSRLTINHVDNVKIVKSTVISDVKHSSTGETLPIRHYIVGCRFKSTVRADVDSLDLYIDNSYIGGCLYNRTGGNSNPKANHIEARNSIITVGGITPTLTNNSTFTNCILKMSSTDTKMPSSNNVYYCVGLTDGMFSSVIGSGIAGNTNSYSDYATMFKTFTGTYDENETFELTDAAKTTYLGDDGTQVGLYGGNMPYNPKPHNPIITNFKVGEKSTPAGKLSVDIEVKAAE